MNYWSWIKDPFDLGRQATAGAVVQFIKLNKQYRLTNKTTSYFPNKQSKSNFMFGDRIRSLHEQLVNFVLLLTFPLTECRAKDCTTIVYLEQICNYLVVTLNKCHVSRIIMSLNTLGNLTCGKRISWRLVLLFRLVRKGYLRIIYCSQSYEYIKRNKQ